MSDPICAQKAPYILDLKAGEYWWCSCGKSVKQPFCDGSHQGTDFQPLRVALEKDSSVGLCGCKRTKNAPHCDGSHKTMA